MVNSRKKPVKKTAKKTVAKKRGAAAKAAPRKRRSSAENERQLLEDLSFYEGQSPNVTTRRTKGTKKHPRGIPISNLIYDDKKNTYRSASATRGKPDIEITAGEYKKLAQNPYAVPTYTPIRERRNGKTVVVAFENSITHKRVSPYYRYQIFGKEFKREQTPVLRERKELYEASLEQQRLARVRRHYNLAESYQLLHPDMTVNKIVGEPEFQDLVVSLSSFNYRKYGINLENVEIADTELGGDYNREYSEEEVELLKEMLGEDPDYQEVLVGLGRRLPMDTNAVGDSDPNHIKFTVEPFLRAQHGAVEFSEDDE